MFMAWDFSKPAQGSEGYAKWDFSRPAYELTTPVKRIYPPVVVETRQAPALPVAPLIGPQPTQQELIRGILDAAKMAPILTPEQRAEAVAAPAPVVPEPVLPEVAPPVPQQTRLPGGVLESIARTPAAVADAFLRGIGKTVGLAQAGEALGKKYPEAAELARSPLAKAALEGKLMREPKGKAEQVAEVAGQIVPYVAGGGIAKGVSSVATGVLKKYAPKLAGTTLGRLIPSIVGTSALGGAVAAGREAMKGIAAPDTFDISEALKEVGSDAARFGAFAAAGEFVGKPVGQAITRALSKSIQAGRVTPQLANLISAPARGGATGLTLASVETAIKFLKDPDEFDKAEAAGDILTTGLFFAGLDTVFALGSMAGQGFRMKGRTAPDLNAAYAELGLNPGAPMNEVKKAYRNLAKQYHPDIKPGNQDKFIRISLAYAEIMRSQPGVRPEPKAEPKAEPTAEPAPVRPGILPAPVRPPVRQPPAPATPVPAAEAAPAAEAPGVAAKKIKAGDIVYHPKTGERLTVADISDPAQFTVQNEAGTTFKIGRGAVRLEPPEAVLAPEAVEPEAEGVPPVEAERPTVEVPETPKPEAKPAAKEPWEMTREEYIQYTLDNNQEHQNNLKNASDNTEIAKKAIVKTAIHKHNGYVTAALAEGKPVPPEVLADYPELKAEGKPAETTGEMPRIFYVKVGTKNVEVIKNPTNSEYQQLSKEFRKEYPRAPKDEIQIRTTYDEKGNKYIWRADNATHDAIEKHLQTVYGVKASQNAPVIESETESTEVEPEAVKETKKPPAYKNLYRGELQIEQHQHPFLSPDGLLTKPNLSHHEVAYEYIKTADKPIHKFMDQTGYIRLTGERDSLSVEMLKMPTNKQFDAIKRAAGDRTIYWDISGKDGKIKKSGQSDNFNEFRKQISSAFEAKPEVKAAEEAKPAELTPVSSGKTVTAKTERGTAIETKYAVVEADSLVASHDTRLKENPDYPKELQPRDRTRMASELQINRIVQKLEPEFLGESPKVSEGAPIVGKDGIVESGNARTIALQRLYEQKHKNAELYKNWIKDNAEKFGIDKETLETAKNPVLVRIRQTDIDRVKFTQEANEQAVAAMSASEQAQADAKKLTGMLMEVFNPSESGDIVTAGNRLFISGFLSEVVSEAERGKYITKDGSISQEGVARIRNAVFAKAYGDTGAIEKLAESTDANVKNQINAMLIAAPRLIKLNEAMDKGELYDLNISHDLAAAMNKLSYLRETGQTVDNYLRQMSLVEDLSPLAKEVLYAFDKHKRSSKRIASILQAYADSVELAGNPNQQTIFAQNAPSKEEIWTRAVRKAEGLDEEALQTTIFQSQGMGDKGTGQAGEKAAGGAGKAEKKLDQVMTEMGEEVDRVVGDVNIPVGQTVRIVSGSPKAKGTFSSADPDIDARVKASHGVKSPSTFSKIKELAESLVRMASREYEHLPRGKEFAPVRLELLKLSKQKGVAADETLRFIQGILIDFKNNPKAYNHFEWKVLLNDLAEEAKAGRDLPFGYTEEKLKTDIERLDEALKDYPQVTRAVEKRRKVWDAIVDAYIDAQEAIGFKVEGKFTKQDYYRHMVLDYANERRTPSGTGKKLRTPTGAFYLKQRKGSTLDINTNYLEAEYEVMAQMLYDIERSKVIKFIDNEANIIDKLKGSAKSTNHSNIMKHFEQMAKRMNKDKAPDKWVTAEDMYRRTLNKKQAMGFNRLAEMAEHGELPGDEDPKWSKAIDALARGDESDNTMAYLSWLVKNHGNTEAGENAALIFKGIHEKDRYIRETLGNKFVTWEDIIPEGYATWQPREGNVFYFADSIPSQYAEELIAKGLKEIGVAEKDIRQVLAMGRKFPEMVIREELALTLDNLTKDKPSDPLSDGLKNIMRAWKVYQLVSPKRWAKYNIRNISGDAEAAYLGNPSTFTKVPRAAKELYRVFAGDGAMTKDMRDWFERGGMQSLLQAQEIGDVNNLRMFVDLMEKKGKVTELPTKVWQGYWKAARLSTDYREAILRYAAYLDYLEQIKAGKGKPKNFGASVPEEVMALKSDEDKAYWLSNDLLGAYDRVSVIGQKLRDHLIPFWSFQEVNFKRYLQFIKNAARDEKAAEMVGRIAASTVKITLKRSPFIAYRIGMFLIKAVGVWAALNTYNKMRWPEEEKELPPDVRNIPHIVLGRDKDGKVLYFTRLGILSDFLEWFGLEEAPGLVGDFLNGKKNLKEIVAEMAKGSANKVIQAVGPQYKTPAELIMGRKVFPDAFDPGMIRDRWYYVFQSLDLDEEYSAIFKLPRKPYKETLKNFLVYSQDPGQGAYYEIRDLNREFQKKILGKTAGGWYSDEISAKSRALYNLKLAIRYQDAEAMKRYAAEYVSHGGTADGLKTSLRNMHPLHGLKKSEEKAFIAWLDEEDRERLILAMEFYTNVLKGEGSKAKKEEEAEEGKEK
jgi:hypothetical protein